MFTKTRSPAEERTDMSGKKMKIAVVGAGLMGHGIAQIFALSGHSVQVCDISSEALEQVRPKVEASLEQFVHYGLVDAAEIPAILERIQTSTSMVQAVQGAGLVFEAVLENMELKQNIFAELDELCPPEVILATNTSVMSITEIALKSQSRGRIVGTHFWNPPHLIPLVEVVPGAETSQETVEATYDLLAQVGKHPVRVKRDVPGFLANRMQHALWREAISIVEHGIADPAEVDEAVKYGFGIRLAVLGPMENVDLVGTDLTFAIHDYVLKHLESSPDPSPALTAKLQAGNLGFKTGKGFQEWSDEGIQEVRNRLMDHLLKWHVAQKNS
jgi:3-hydroxybutyryl-CoA dehydrogenase